MAENAVSNWINPIAQCLDIGGRTIAQPAIQLINLFQLLTTSPLYNPQVYAIRRLVTSHIDTRDDIDEVQIDVRQRWQTKRGYPGAQHIIDWMTLDLSATAFPAPNRDNFGSTFAFLEYDWTWNVGDRTALTSSGWIDPETDGPRFFAFGAYLNRTDRTNLFLGYRQIDPLESKAVTAAVSYVFSPKYAMTASAVYDFGTSQALSNSLVLTRVGTDFLSTLTAMFNPLPAIALLPLALLWFGLGAKSLVLVIIHSVLWAVALNTHSGFTSVSPTLRMAGQNCGLRGVSYVAFLLVPAAFPSILTGLKIGWAFAWRTLIAAELVFGVSSGQGGLGWYIFENRNLLDIPAVFAGLLTVIIIGLIVENLIFRTIERNTVQKWGTQT